jgi:hypothetical protein
MHIEIASQLDLYIFAFALIAFALALVEMFATRGRSRLVWAVLCLAAIPLIRRITFGD